MFDILTAEFRYTARRLAARPLFAAGVVGTLGLALGAATAVFAVVYGVLLRLPAYRDPARLATVRADRALDGAARPVVVRFPLDALDVLSRPLPSLEAIAFYGSDQALARRDGFVEPVEVADVSA